MAKFLSFAWISIGHYGAPVGYKNVDPRLGFLNLKSSALNYDQAEFSTDFRTAYKQLTTERVPQNLYKIHHFQQAFHHLLQMSDLLPNICIGVDLEI